MAVNLDPVRVFIEDLQHVRPRESVMSEMVVDAADEIVILRGVNGPPMV